jgi:hypothetical protein
MDSRIVIPEVCFSAWTKWSNRNKLPNVAKSGVYLIATFAEEPPDGPADPREKGVVYIGESASGRIQQRLRAFGRAAFQGKGKNRGGRRYQHLFGTDSSTVYVSTLSGPDLVRALLGLATCSLLDISQNNFKGEVNEVLDEANDLAVKYIERKLLLLHFLAHEHRPACNTD